MKFFPVFILSAFISLGLNPVFAAEVSGLDGVQAPERVFTPFGFDNNDNAQVVLYGHFPDTCYRAGAAKAEIRGQDIFVRNASYRKENESCLSILVPWATTVDLGNLRSGRYSVFVETAKGWVRFNELEIFPSLTPKSDNFMYAYVDGASVSRTDSFPTLTITGSYNLTCMEIQKVVVKETDGVIVVLPIVWLKPGVPCGHPFAPIPFTKQIRLRPEVKQPSLIHIRSMNGQALNSVIDFR